MAVLEVDTLVVGGGQAGLAMSAQLRKQGRDHLIVERNRIAESWRTRRWDSLVANGPAWHDRFPDRVFDIDPDDFASKGEMVDYFEAFARQIDAPVREGVEVLRARRSVQSGRFVIETSEGVIEAINLVVATGPFQRPSVPSIIPQDAPVEQIHSISYRNPGQLSEGAVLVVGGGSSGVQIADELLRAGRAVYLSVGPHSRPPRRYRGKDFCWWLGALGHWNATRMPQGKEHVTIAVSGARGGHTVDFRELASRGMVLVGKLESYSRGAVTFSGDLAENVSAGDEDYLAILEQADAYVRSEGLDFPEEPGARLIRPDPLCITNPLTELDLAKAGVRTVIWATGFDVDFGWLDVDGFDQSGRPVHSGGVSAQVPGLYFLGLPWLTCRGSAFIWGVWEDACAIADHLAAHSAVSAASA